MGTNFYFLTRDKEKRDKWFDYGEYELTDSPDFGYEIHLAKTSCGWLPLFQAHKRIRSVSTMKECYDGGGFDIIDEYGNYYTWNEFQERVLEFNGGVRGAIPITKHEPDDPGSRFFDPDMPNHTPVSHFEYGNGKYARMFYADQDGYEFDERQFS